MEKIEFVIRLVKDSVRGRFNLSFDILIDGKTYDMEDIVDRVRS